MKSIFQKLLGHQPYEIEVTKTDEVSFKYPVIEIKRFVVDGKVTKAEDWFNEMADDLKKEKTKSHCQFELKLMKRDEVIKQVHLN
ncbi:hypothetical protein [Algivirga pacifica]|uniref:Uncharacterized protein n=1 Tax=Algivirga pacifica TaxID=1162670 RepID=A0ABP9CYM2_9BACT